MIYSFCKLSNVTNYSVCDLQDSGPTCILPVHYSEYWNTIHMLFKCKYHKKVRLLQSRRQAVNILHRLVAASMKRPPERVAWYILWVCVLCLHWYFDNWHVINQMTSEHLFIWNINPFKLSIKITPLPSHYETDWRFQRH